MLTILYILMCRIFHFLLFPACVYEKKRHMDNNWKEDQGQGVKQLDIWHRYK